MSGNRIGENYGPLNTSNNSPIGGGGNVVQTEQNFNVDGKSEQTALTMAFSNLNKIVTEKTKPCFKNSWKNFWNRGRKGALLQTQAALDTLKGKDGKFTLGKLEYNTDLFNEALNNKGLSKVSREALETLVSELKAKTGIRFKTTYSETQLKEMFRKIKLNKRNLLGKGSFGKVYACGKDLVFKVINDKEAFENDVNGNKAFQKGTNNFTKNKEFFYRQSNGLITEYIGSFKENGQYIAVFERVEGEDMDQILKQQNTSLEKKPIEQFEKSKETVDLQRCIMLSQMAEGISAVHESGCINRDIKPQNTMIGYRETEEPERNEKGDVIRNEKGEIQMKKVTVPYAKLIDQGLTVDMKSGEGLRNIGYAGTPRFMAPETILKKDTSPACDVFSFGITLLTTTCDNSSPFLEARNQMNGKRKNASVQETYFNNLPKTINECYTTITPTGEKTCTQPFLRDLVLKCCSFNPADRPSAAQVAYCLQFYTSVIGTEAEKTLKFDEVLKMAEADRPKSIPLALREMMQSDNKDVRQRGCTAVLNFGNADPSYKKTPSYGLALLRCGKTGKFNQWATKNSSALQQLGGRIYTGQKPQNEGGVWSEKDIKVSQDEFNTINRLFSNENVNPKNIA